MPCRMSHASIPSHVRKERNLPEDLIRLCIGIEDVDDLIDDLKFALEQAGWVTNPKSTLNVNLKNTNETISVMKL